MTESNHDSENVNLSMQIGIPARPLPEQAIQQRPPQIPRPVSFLSIIYQWQPMGIRVVANLPFVSDDFSTLFCIRNGPYIADWREDWRVPNTKAKCGMWAFTVTNTVISTSNLAAGNDVSYPKDYPIFISYYDSPPLLSQISKCFRRWRGDMQYRIRIIAGFVTQGYLIFTPIKNAPANVSKMDIFKRRYWLGTTDKSSFRPMMQNAYIMSDTSMYRHVEVTMPYEYPTPWYDQYQWLQNRVYCNRTASNPDNLMDVSVYPQCFVEPFSDNWLAGCVRGSLEPTRDTSQITFELEYRAVEGFQFADPGLPPNNLVYTSEQVLKWDHGYPFKVLTIPSTKYASNGVDYVMEVKQASAVAAKLSVPVVPSRLERIGSAPGYRGHHRVHRDFGSDDPPPDADEIERVRSGLAGVSTQTEGIDVADTRTPSQRRRDSEFVY